MALAKKYSEDRAFVRMEFRASWDRGEEVGEVEAVEARAEAPALAST